MAAAQARSGGASAFPWIENGEHGRPAKCVRYARRLRT